MTRGALALALVALSVACTNYDAVECFDCAPPGLRISPPDLTTGEGLLTIRVEVFGSTVDDAMLDAIARGARLRTYPELVDVPFVAVSHPRSGSGSSQAVSSIEIAPKTPLSPGFFVVTLDGLPGSFGAPAHPLLPAEPRAHAARFGVGAMPVVRSVTMNERGVVMVGFSEPLQIHLTKIAAQLRVFDASLAECTYLPPGIPSPPPTTPGTVVVYQCRPEAYGAKKVHLEFGDPLVTSSGVPLRLLDSRSSTAAELLRPLSPMDAELYIDTGAGASWTP